MSRQHDGELIAASVARPELFEPIFERHFDAVVRFVIGRMGRDAATDIAAETFLRAFERRRRFEPERPSAVPWLFGIAANVCRERARSDGRWARARYREASMSASGGEFEGDAVDRLDAELLGSRLAAALRTLAPDEYQVLMLAAHTDLTYAEIADHLRIPIGTVRSRLSRTRARVRELMDGLEPIHTAPGHG